MATGHFPLQSFNRGLLSPLALARTDLTSRVPFSAALQTNWMPRTLGSMMLRPGLGYTGSTHNNQFSKTIPFVFSISDTAELEMTNQTMRVWVNDQLVTRPDVVGDANFPLNPNFTTDLSQWVDNDESGATSVWDDGSAYGLSTGGYMRLLGTGFTSAIRYQQVSVTVPNVLHALRVVVSRGPVNLRIGSTIGGDDYLSEITLNTGTHSITYLPTGALQTFQFSSSATYSTFIDSAQTESTGTLELPTPWTTANLPYLRWTQSADVVFIAANAVQQYRVERRSSAAWSVVLYQSNDGPFRNSNISNISLTPAALNGDTTLTASGALFKSTQVGALFKVTSVGQTVTTVLTGANQFGDPIRVVGVGASRTFTFVTTGVFTSTYTLQRSVGDVGSWIDVGDYTGTGTVTINDALDNQIVYYRIGIKTGNYTSGTVTVTLSYANGGLTGIGRITKFTSETVVSVQVLTPFGSTTSSTDWAEGSWSDYRGWPGAVALYEGRLWWAGKGFNWGSVSDGFTSFDDTVEGDAGPINRSIGEGPVDNIAWLLPLQRLVIGGEGDEYSARSTSFDEPLTPTNYNVKSPSTQGSSNVQALKVDTYGIFVQKSSQRIFSISYNAAADDFTTTDITLLCPQVGDQGVTSLGVQRMPDTRIHSVRGDGQVAVMVTDPLENVRAWVMMQTDAASGQVEDCWVLPGVNSSEDRVYYTVNRTINGGTVRYREKWALENECVGGTQNKQADCFVAATQAPSVIISGLSHLEGQQVIVWADGIDYSPGTDNQTTFTVTGGSITLPAAVTNYVVGLPYKAQYRSTKLAYAAQAGTALTQMKKVGTVGIIATSMHAKGLQYGSDFDQLKELPDTENEVAVPPNFIWPAYDQIPFTFNGTWNTDSRLCLQATAPRPVTLLAAIIGLTTNERVP